MNFPLNDQKKTKNFYLQSYHQTKQRLSGIDTPLSLPSTAYRYVALPRNYGNTWRLIVRVTFKTHVLFPVVCQVSWQPERWQCQLPKTDICQERNLLLPRFACVSVILHCILYHASNDMLPMRPMTSPPCIS